MQESKQKYASKQAQALYEGLLQKGVKAELEYSDGHKTVDIAILEARLFIEVDGIQHFTDANQILRDFKRYHYSDGDDFSTFYVTNQIIENYLEEVVEALVKVIDIKKNNLKH